MKKLWFVAASIALAIAPTAALADDGGADAAADASDDAKAGAAADAAASDDAGGDAGAEASVPPPEGIQPTTTPDNLGCAVAYGPRGAGDALPVASFAVSAIAFAAARRRRKSV